MKQSCLFLAAMALLLIACGKDKTTQPSSSLSSLITSKLAVSIPSGGDDNILVYSRDNNGGYSDCHISLDNSSVAACTITDSILQISALSLGTANLTISNSAGKSCILPIEVYDKNILDAGEFLIAYTTDYGSYPVPPFYMPVPPEGFFPLCALCLFGWPGDSVAVITVKPKTGSDAIVFTHNFISDSVYVNSLWMPVPPPGYKAMGYIYSEHGLRPDSQACIREDLTTEAVVENALHIDNGNVWSLWKIEEPYCGPHSKAYLAPSGFIAVRSINAPVNHPLANVLNVDLQTVAGVTDRGFAPKLTSFSPPPMETPPTVSKALLVPFSVITDLINNIGWQIDNSPTYRLDRQVIYKCLYHNYNQTDVLQENSYEVVSGISSTQSETFRAKVGVALTAELGVSFSPTLSGKIAATVSYEVGYERLTGITEFQETHRITSLNIPPGKAGAIWQRFNRFTLYRHTGNAVEIVGTQDIGIDSYVTDVYPDN